ncbi:MAG: hypothetical protein A2794_03535 [Alphaproteobacteria bacterium RIFCSPHIGHO2_01_FULL_40_8]|nr:MAG: hypothetical protein A2794_03535 [Alphaproteobacteria bacterium RIFCSPHIGHO2_01_FULL_40_8]
MFQDLIFLDTKFGHKILRTINFWVEFGIGFFEINLSNSLSYFKIIDETETNSKKPFLYFI